MFPVLPPGTNARSLTVEDITTFLKAYPSAATLASANRLGGTVTDHLGFPLAGAAVFAIDVASGDTLGSDMTLANGEYLFLGLPDGDYEVATHPLDQSEAVGYISTAAINWMVHEWGDKFQVVEAQVNITRNPGIEMAGQRIIAKEIKTFI